VGRIVRGESTVGRIDRGELVLGRIGLLPAQPRGANHNSSFIEFEIVKIIYNLEIVMLDLQETVESRNFFSYKNKNRIMPLCWAPRKTAVVLPRLGSKSIYVEFFEFFSRPSSVTSNTKTK
jgi:hypothetical protein